MSLSNQDKELIQRSFIEKLSDDEAVQLNQLLTQSQEGRNYYRHAASLDSVLRDHDADAETELITPTKTSFTLWKVAAIFFMGLSFVLSAVLFSPTEDFATIFSSETDSIALVQHAVNLSKRDASSLHEGKSLKEGTLNIEKGMVQLDFISGVTLIGKGPLALELVNDMKVKCLSGSVRVLVPPQATGFKVITPDTEVLDLGTEFGVVVSDEGSNVAVIDGKVELYENDKMEKELNEGEQVHVKSGEYNDKLPSKPLPSPIDLALALEQRALAKNQFWLDSIATIQKDSDLEIYYDFRKKDPWGKILHNLMEPNKSLSYGAIIGAKWSDGRLGPETALEFKGNHNFIRLEDHRIYESMTLLTWVRIDSLDVAYTSLLHSDNWSTQAVHWHISNKGILTYGINSKFGENSIIRSPQNTISENHFGKWIQIVSTYDGPNQQCKQYINGKLVDQKENMAQVTAKIGKAQIGAWLRGNTQAARGLNGRIDRFAVWSKALTEAEIKQLYLQGNPIAQFAALP